MSEQVDTLDEVKLAEYLSEHIERFAGPVTATKFEGGQSNPTFNQLIHRRNGVNFGRFILRRPSR